MRYYIYLVQKLTNEVNNKSNKEEKRDLFLDYLQEILLKNNFVNRKKIGDIICNYYTD